MSGGILNPPRAAEVCLQMIARVRNDRSEMERQLSTQLLDRETYLQMFGAAQALRQVEVQVEAIYNRTFGV